MQPGIAFGNKKAGLCYALTDDGVELPVIDITQGAFAVSISAPELDSLLQKHIHEVKSRAKTPAVLQRLLFGIIRRRSVLMRGIMDSAGGFLNGMNTYIMKLGPDNMGKSYAGSIDRNIAASLPVLTIRLRLRDLARLLAEGLIHALQGDTTGTLHLLNIGGGPAMDSINRLILIQKERPNLLTERPVTMCV